MNDALSQAFLEYACIANTCNIGVEKSWGGIDSYQELVDIPGREYS